MIGAFLAAYGLEIAFAGTFLTGMSVYSYLKLKGTSKNKFKVQYCDVREVIKQYKRIDKQLSDSVGGNKNEKFFN